MLVSQWENFLFPWSHSMLSAENYLMKCLKSSTCLVVACLVIMCLWYALRSIAYMHVSPMLTCPEVSSGHVYWLHVYDLLLYTFLLCVLSLADDLFCHVFGPHLFRHICNMRYLLPCYLVLHHQVYVQMCHRILGWHESGRVYQHVLNRYVLRHMFCLMVSHVL